MIPKLSKILFQIIKLKIFYASGLLKANLKPMYPYIVEDADKKVPMAVGMFRFISPYLLVFLNIESIMWTQIKHYKQNGEKKTKIFLYPGDPFRGSLRSVNYIWI